MTKIHNFPILYKNSNRKTETWQVVASLTNENIGIITVKYGQLDGKIQEKITIIKQGKNIGKLNETSVWEQTILESNSKINRQKDKGYSEVLENCQKTILPMLAKSYADFPHKLQFPCFIQPKLDGIRCLGSSEGLMSRKGKKFTALPHIKKLTSHLPINIILDGELFSRDLPFQKITSICRQIEPDPDYEKVQYHVYDLIDLKNPNLVFSERQKLILQYLGVSSELCYRIVDTYKIAEEKEIGERHQEFLKAGYEGSILRNDAEYEIDKRSFNLLKLKDFQDKEFEITGVEQDKNGHPVFTCITDTQTTFAVKPQGSDEERTRMWKNRNKCMGKMLTVKFFEWTTSNPPVPRFPVGISIRDYE